MTMSSRTVLGLGAAGVLIALATLGIAVMRTADAARTQRAGLSGVAIDGVDAMAVIDRTGCLACHSIDGVGGQVAPKFEELVGRDHAFIRESIVDPGAEINREYAAFAGTMPAMFGDMLSEAELEAVVRFLASGGQPDGASGGGEGGG